MLIHTNINMNTNTTVLTRTKEIIIKNTKGFYKNTFMCKADDDGDTCAFCFI